MGFKVSVLKALEWCLTLPLGGEDNMTLVAIELGAGTPPSSPKERRIHAGELRIRPPLCV